MSSVLGIVSAGLGIVGALSQRRENEQSVKRANEQRRREYDQQMAEMSIQQQQSAEQTAKSLQAYQDEVKDRTAQTRVDMAASGIDLSSEGFSHVLAELDADSKVASLDAIKSNSQEQAQYDRKKYTMRNNFMEQNLLGTSKYAWGGIGSVIGQLGKQLF